MFRVLIGVAIMFIGCCCCDVQASVHEPVAVVGQGVVAPQCDPVTGVCPVGSACATGKAACNSGAACGNSACGRAYGRSEVRYGGPIRRGAARVFSRLRPRNWFSGRLRGGC